MALFCDVEFIVGELETRIPAHIAMVAARSQFLRARIRQAREKRDKLEQQFINVSSNKAPPLEVKDLARNIKNKNYMTQIYEIKFMKDWENITEEIFYFLEISK